jgi:catechol 2,3-dioxygenase-like lactoylglutathione lyase family enzyme
MSVVNKFTMLQAAVDDMPKAKEFYAEKLGLEVVKDFRMDDNNWWVELALPEGDVHITLTTHHDHMKPGALTLYFATSDIQKAHDELADMSIEVSEVQDDLHGPGSGVKWFNFKDPAGNLVHIEQA